MIPDVPGGTGPRSENNVRVKRGASDTKLTGKSKVFTLRKTEFRKFDNKGYNLVREGESED